MRWTPGGQSGDVEDRRGQSYGGGFRGGPASIGVVLVLLVLSLLTGRNFLALLGPGGVETEAPTETNAPPAQESPEEKRLSWAGSVPGGGPPCCAATGAALNMPRPASIMTAKSRRIVAFIIRCSIEVEARLGKPITSPAA